MVIGLDLFRERFREFEGSFVLIGGAACHEWFAQQGVEFRSTKDLDLVLIVEMLDPPFVAALRAFIAEGKYAIQEKSEGVPLLYRFAKPNNPDFPFTLELFSRKPNGIELADGQHIVPIPAGTDHHSLSAFLLDQDYYELIRNQIASQNGLPFANATALIPLKAHAWLNLTKAREAGEEVATDNITKHRSDVFRLAATLPGEPGPDLTPSIKTDLATFLEAFPPESNEWQAILASIKNTLGGGIRPTDLRLAIQTYFRLPSVDDASAVMGIH